MGQPPVVDLELSFSQTMEHILAMGRDELSTDFAALMEHASAA